MASYNQKNPEQVQRQLAVYLMWLRADNQREADQLNQALWVVPMTWCSVILPSRTPKQFDTQIARADADGKRMARLLDVSFEPPASPSTLAFLRHARDQAGLDFCPGQVAHPGHPVADTSPVAELRDQTPLLEAPVSSYWWTQAESGAKYWSWGRDELAQILVGVFAQHAQGRKETALLDCDVVADLTNDEDSTARRARDTLDRQRSTGAKKSEVRRHNISLADDHARSSFDQLEQRRRCGLR